MPDAKTELVLDQEYLPVLTKLLNEAKSSIDILAFSFAIGSASGTISRSGAPFKIATQIAALKKKFGRKLKIRLYIEGLRDTAERNRITTAYLQDMGVEIKLGATHAKGFCIDGKTVLFGSTNLTNQSILKNNETNLLLRDSAAVAGFQRYFSHLWQGGKHGGIVLNPPMLADGAFKAAVIDSIDRAKKQLEFSIYFFDQAEFTAAFIRAHERGVHIKGFLHQHYSFALDYVRRTKNTVTKLRKAGIEDLHFAPGTLFTHSKYLIRDRAELILGTGNWLNEDVLIHPQLYIALRDKNLATRLAAHLKAQIEQQAVD